MKIGLPLIVVFISLLFVNCSSTQHFNIGFYNVENMFDTIDNPRKRDNEFTPEGKKKWDTERYQNKIKNIAQVIDSMPNLVLLGLCEVENKSVLADLIANERIYKDGYSVIHQDSPDKRGIDIAAIYKADFFELINYQYYSVMLPNRKTLSTRDLLYIKGIPFNSDTLHLFINHWPSRYGGQEKTIPDRMHLAQFVNQKIDSIKQINSNSNIIIMGDLNDTPNDSSVIWLAHQAELINPANTIPDSLGTYNYNNKWDILDHILYTQTMVNNKALFVKKNAYQIFGPQFVLYQKRDKSYAPNRTFGYKYFGGYSDHLPVLLQLNYKNKRKF